MLVGTTIVMYTSSCLEHDIILLECWKLLPCTLMQLFGQAQGSGFLKITTMSRKEEKRKKKNILLGVIESFDFKYTNVGCIWYV